MPTRSKTSTYNAARARNSAYAKFKESSRANRLAVEAAATKALASIKQQQSKQYKIMDMAYKFEIPLRYVETMFGTAFSTLDLGIDYRLMFLREIFADMVNLTPAPAFSPGSSYGDLVVTDGMNTLNGKYVVAIRNDVAQGFSKMKEIEQFVNNIPRLGLLSSPRWWDKLRYGNQPSETFELTTYDIPKVYMWLCDNCHHSQYRIFDKYGAMTLGFTTPELAVLFKMTFG